MKNRRKKREAFGEHSYWQSYSDMMAALLLVFVLIIAITLAIYRQKTVDLDQARLDLNAAQTKLDQAALELEDFRVGATKRQLHSMECYAVRIQKTFCRVRKTVVCLSEKKFMVWALVGTGGPAPCRWALPDR